MKIDCKNLCRRNGNFYFRIAVPEDLKNLFGVSEFKRRLRDENLKNAAAVCNLLSRKFKAVFEETRSRPMDIGDIKKAVSDYLKWTLQQEEVNTILDGVRSPADISREAVSCGRYRDYFRKKLAKNELDSVSRMADDMIEMYKMPIEKDSLDYKILCRELLKMHVAWFEEARQRTVANNMSEYRELLSTPAPASVPAKEEAPREILTLKQLAGRYCDEKMKSDRWVDKTIRAQKGVFSLLMEVFGENANIREFTHKKLLDFRDNVLCKMPANRSKFEKYKGKTYSEILKMPGVRTMSAVTINDDLVMLSGFFKWCCKHEYVHANMAEGLRLEISRRAKEAREVYSKEDLEKIIVALKREVVAKKDYHWKFWIPMIAMYSGMRQGEIAQLYLEDVKKDSDIWFFDVNDNTDDKKVKTGNSRRLVPVHPELIKMGLLKYCESLSKRKNSRLWPELEFKRDGYGQTFQRWYGRFNRAFVTDNTKKVFHSFRHTFSNNLRQNGAPKDQIKALVGHEDDSKDVTERYAKDFAMKQLFESICKLDYGLDLKKLLE